MLLSILVGLFCTVNVFLIFMIFLQKGKNSLGLGSLGGGSQMLFGGTGGQDIFQKITWFLVAFFLLGSLGLALYKNKVVRDQGLSPRPAPQELPY